MATLSTDKLIEEHFTPPTQEELEGMPTPSGGGPSDLIKPAANLTEPDLDPEQEVVEERTERTKTYDLGNGKYRTVGSPVKAHYEEEGQFKELDLTIEEKSDRFELVQEGGSSNAPYELNIRKGMIGYGVSHKQGGQVHLKLDQLGNRPLNPKFIQNNVSITVGGNVIIWRIDSLDLSLRVVARPEKVELYKTLETDQAPRSFKWTVAEEKNDSARFTFNPHGAAGQDNTGDRLELNESRSTIDQDDTFEYSEYVEKFTGRSAKIADPETRSRSWKSAEYPVEIDPSTSKDITANLDDVTDVPKDNRINSLDVDLGYVSVAEGTYIPGLRFRSLGISQGATIDSATLQVNISSTWYGGDIGDVYADLVTDAPQWSSNDRPTGINKSNNTKSWAWSATGLTTTGITSMFQEVVNQSGWSSGNAARFAIFNNATTGFYAANADDYSDTSPDVATLSVTWIEPTTVSTRTGTVTAQDASVSGSLSSPATVGGSVSAQTVDITSSLSNISTVKGGVSAGQSAIDGSVSSISTITGTSTASEASVGGSISTITVISFTTDAQKSSTSGSLSLLASIQGTADSNNSKTSGGVSNVVVVGGSTSSDDSSVSGTGLLVVSVSGTPTTQNSSVSGSIVVRTNSISGTVSSQKSSTSGSVSKGLGPLTSTTGVLKAEPLDDGVRKGELL